MTLLLPSTITNRVSSCSCISNSDKGEPIQMLARRAPHSRYIYIHFAISQATSGGVLSTCNGVLGPLGGLSAHRQMRLAGSGPPRVLDVYHKAASVRRVSSIPCSRRKHRCHNKLCDRSVENYCDWAAVCSIKLHKM